LRINCVEAGCKHTAVALYGRKMKLLATLRPMAPFPPAKLAKPLQDMPFHSGTLKYCEEIGLAPKH
jgi:hypothetical protein